MSSKQGNIGVTSENIFPIIKKFLYSDHEIFLRELVSNAVDATQKLKTLSSVGEFKGELGDLTVQVKFDDKTITISDRGIGMTAEEYLKGRQYPYLFPLYLFASGICLGGVHLFLVVPVATLAVSFLDSGRNELFRPVLREPLFRDLTG